jgi:hypothetical protein
MTPIQGRVSGCIAYPLAALVFILSILGIMK